MLLGLFGIVIGVMTYILFNQTRLILSDRLKERLIGITATAALQFDPGDISAVVDESSIGSESFVRLVNTLQAIRNTNNNVFFSYLLRPTKQPQIFEFIADADSMDPYASIDLNGDGIIDESDALNVPGEEYDASEVPALINEAIYFPTTDPEPITADAWGTYISSYAPIKVKGETIAILTLDVEVSDYIQLVNRTLWPFVVFVIFLFVILSIMTIVLVRMWASRVALLRELDRQKDELLSIVSHQLATPVTSVKWYLEMLLDGDSGELTEEQKKQLMTMQGVTADLVDLVGMILDVSRIQLGRMKVDRADLNLGEFFTEVLAVIEPKATVKKQQFIKVIPKSLPVASLDKRLMRMTLENLLSNAVKYTPEGGKVELKVEVKDSILRYTVRDTGCGIPKEDQEKIFGKLFRATNVRDTEGNGLGLFAAKGAAEAQGGKVWFTSESGKGTTFYVEVPLTEAKGQK